MAEHCKYTTYISEDEYSSERSVFMRLQDLSLILRFPLNAQIKKTEKGYGFITPVNCSAFIFNGKCLGTCLKEQLKELGIERLPVDPCLKTDQGGGGK